MLLSVGAFSQTIINGGYVSGVWDSTGNPYYIEAPIYIHEDSALEIQAGVMIEFNDTSYLEVRGMVSAAGLPGDSIFFTSSGESWQGIRIQPNDSLTSEYIGFYHCVFSNARAPEQKDDGGVIWANWRENLGFTHCSFRNNFADDRGGAVYILNGKAQMKYCRFLANHTGNGFVAGTSKGGAIYIVNGKLTLEYVDFIDNEAVVAGALYTDNSDLDNYYGNYTGNTSRAGGGAMVCHNGGLIVVNDASFEANTANGSGGSVALLEAIIARFTRCRFYDNTAHSAIYLADGGGVMVTPYDNSVSFVNCDFSGNTAGDYGGGVYATSDSRIIDCLFYNNRANTDTLDAGGGGALCFSLDSHLILNCTFSGNSGGEGNTILCEDTRLSMLNSIIWDDSLGADAKIFLSNIEDQTELFVDYCDIEGGRGAVRGDPGYLLTWKETNINADPLFEVPGVFFALSNESPCIDTGRSDTLQVLIPSKDLNGNPRIYRDKIDLGCYENQFPFAVEELAAEPSFQVFPNPAHECLMVEMSDIAGSKTQVFFHDIMGRLVFAREFNTFDHRLLIQLPDMPSGLYVMKITSKESSWSGKIIIE